MKKQITFLIVMFSVLCLVNSALGAIIVGRLAHVEGQVYRYIDEDQRWVETFVESPAGAQDVLTTESGSRAEISFPNNLLVRMHENAEIEIMKLEEDASVFVLPKGMARFYNQSAAGSLAVETVMGTANVGPGSTVDVHVEGDSVVVYAVHGKATFQSFDNGVEKLEVISGNSSLEFKAGSIAAGVGPINRKWNRWCRDREKVWAQNRLVRSKYLPETMQEYAHVLEPSGTWRRISYHGYYYWAWQPRYVTAGWSPYTSGTWYDWHGGPVWIDHNPWGWVTHHHGHWLHKHGSWMWTPYVHGPYVPGVNVIGLTITFGKRFRPYWHPGRVRWIAHSGYIGWLPLAPRETYYGHRRWGPRSRVVHGGFGFSITINLANHRYVDHAVVIQKRHFYKRRARSNNYNTVKIKNINKTIIVKNYKPLTAAGWRNNKHALKVAQTGKLRDRAAFQPEKKEIKRRGIVAVKKHARKKDLAIQAYENGKKERVVSNRRQRTVQEVTGTVATKRNAVGRVERQKRISRSEQRALVKKSENSTNKAGKRRITGINSPQRSNAIKASNRNKENISRQSVARVRNRSSVRQQNKIDAGNTYSNGERKQVREQTRIEQKQVQQYKDRDNRSYKRGSRNYGAEPRPKVTNKVKQTAGRQQHYSRKSTLRENRGDRQQIAGVFDTASVNKHRFRQ